MTDSEPAPVHRVLRLSTPDDVLAEAMRIADADRAGRLRQGGNWAAGQSFGHLATWINFAYDGYPPELRTMWIIRVFAKLLLKKKFIKGPMRPGVRIPGVKGGTVATAPMSTEQGMDMLRKAWARLAAVAPHAPNPLIGPLTHDEWKRLHLRHAELHLGFLHP